MLRVFRTKNGTTQIWRESDTGKVTLQTVPTTDHKVKSESLLWKPDMSNPGYAEDAYGRSKAHCKPLDGTR